MSFNGQLNFAFEFSRNYTKLAMLAINKVEHKRSPVLSSLEATKGIAKKSAKMLPLARIELETSCVLSLCFPV